MFFFHSIFVAYTLLDCTSCWFSHNQNGTHTVELIVPSMSLHSSAGTAQPLTHKRERARRENDEAHFVNACTIYSDCICKMELNRMRASDRPSLIEREFLMFRTNEKKKKKKENKKPKQCREVNKLSHNFKWCSTVCVPSVWVCKCMLVSEHNNLLRFCVCKMTSAFCLTISRRVAFFLFYFIAIFHVRCDEIGCATMSYQKHLLLLFMDYG